jgi:hypothetical protein
MSDDPAISLEALEREEARLRERLTKIAVVKELLRELAIPGSGSAAAQPQAAASLPSPPATPATPAAAPAAPAAPAFAFDGTFAGLIDCYRSDHQSGYRQLKHKVRQNYDTYFNRLIEEIGEERVADWSAQRIKRAYDESWAAGGKIAMGHGMVGKLRLLSGYGSTVLNDDACTRLSAILSNMRFPVGYGARGSRLNVEHARVIRATAHEHFGWPSIALAQAFQYEIPQLRQMDVIGEWVPLSEPGTSEITKGNEKWLRGLRWSDIDDDMVLRRVLTSGRRNEQKEVKFQLKKYYMIMEEINRVPPWKRNGPMIINEVSGLPWSTAEFRRKWRLVADKAGVPKNIKNMDSGREDEQPEWLVTESDPVSAGKKD